MSSDEIVLTADRAHALHWSLAQTRRQPLFWIALVGAALVHAALIVGVTRYSPRTIGDPSGKAGAIDVELVDASELASSGTSAAAASPPAAEPVEPTQPEPAPPTEATPPEEKAPADKPAPEEQAALPPPAFEAPQATAPLESAEKAAPKPAPKQERAAKPPSAKPNLKQKHQLDLSVPWDMATQGDDDGGDSAAVRPPGITRSGENDRFGRDVIRALKKTMPQSAIRGRVMIRIVLNERGNVAQITLLQSAGNRDLDYNVMFAARQAAYPFPPKNATVADRTFLVTYVYR